MEIYKSRIVFIFLLIFLPLSFSTYNDIVDCIAMVGGQKKPSISPDACRDTENAFCSAQFGLDAATIQNNLMA